MLNKKAKQSKRSELFFNRQLKPLLNKDEEKMERNSFLNMLRYEITSPYAKDQLASRVAEEVVCRFSKRLGGY